MYTLGMSVVLSVRLEDDVKSRLEHLAEVSGRSVGDCVRELLDRHLLEYELLDVLAHEAELAASGELETISWEELQDECGLLAD